MCHNHVPQQVWVGAFPSVLETTSRDSLKHRVPRERLSGFEPGFMIPLPRTLCGMFDWLIFGFEMRTIQRNLWEDGEVNGLDNDGAVVNDGCFLRVLTFNRSSCPV